MKARPDVAILLDHFGPGGVERVACHVANGLQRHGLRVEMIVLDDTGPVRSLLNDAVSVRRLGALPSGRRGRRLQTAVPAIVTYLRGSSPRLFHAPGNHTIRPAALAVRLAGFRGAFVAKVTNPVVADRMTPRQRWFRQTLYRWALRQARQVLALSQSSVDQIVAMDARLASRSIVVHNPYVSERMLHHAVDRAPVDPPVILSIGRLSPQKNQALLLRAAARLKDRPWRLRLCGTGPDEGALRALADDLGIGDRLDLVGFVEDPVPEYLKATVLALSSAWEGLPATVLEAVACGCPVVSTASSPGLVALLHEIGARDAVAPNDAAALAQALEEALDGRLPIVPSTAILPYGIDAACDEHAALFAKAMSA